MGALDSVMGFLETAWGLVSMVMGIWFYLILPVLVIAGCYVYVRRSPHISYGIARELEDEGKLEEALKYYRRAAENGRGKPEGRVAEEKVAELVRKLHRGATDV